MTDQFDLPRFLEAQSRDYDTALAEIRGGAKRTHWMWYIFPQLAGLGRSSTAQHFAIVSLEEAKAHLAHPVLGARLRDCARALQNLTDAKAEQVFGRVDATKLRSSLTLFEAAGGGPLFAAALARWFGEPDGRTLGLLRLRAADPT